MRFILTVFVALLFMSSARGAIVIGDFSTYAEDFDDYRGTVGTIPTNFTTAGDLVFYNGNPNDGNAQNGVLTGGTSLYNTSSGWYAMNSAATPGDYAFGLRTQTSSTSSLTTELVNATGQTIAGFNIGWSFEQYTEGFGNARISLLWSTDGTTFVAAGLAGDITRTGMFGASPPVVYQNPAVTPLVASLPLALAAGDSIFLRFQWTSAKSGNQPHVAVDDLSFTPVPVPEPSTLVLGFLFCITVGLRVSRRWQRR